MNTFDLVVLEFDYRKMVVPKKVALAFFELCVSSDFYVLDSHWNGKGSEDHARLANAAEMPKLITIGPTQFHQAVTNYEMHQAAKDTAKE